MPLKIGELYTLLSARDDASAKIDRVGEHLEGARKQSRMLESALVVGLSAGLTKMGKDAWDAGVTFKAGMANVGSLIPGNIARVKELSGEVQKLQISLGKSSQDLTGGLYQVVSAFGDNADTVKSLELNAKAAKAGVASTIDAINLTSAVTKAYGDTSLEAQTKVSDLALMTVRLGQTTFPELAASIGKVTPLTKALGVSQEELFASYAALTGVTGGAAEVSTQLRGVMQGLMAPTADMAELIASLGYSNGEAMMKALGLQGTIAAITKAAQESGNPLQSYISSIEGQTGALALAGAQSEDYAKKLKDIQNASGATEEAYKAQTDGANKMGFAWEQAKQRWQVLLQNMSDVAPIMMAAGSITGIVEGIKLFRQGLTLLLPKKIADTTATVADTVAVNANTTAIMANTAARGANAGMPVGGGVGGALGKVGAARGLLGKAGGALATGGRFLVANPAVAGVALATAAAGYFINKDYQAWKDGKDSLKDAAEKNKKSDKMEASMTPFSDRFAKARENEAQAKAAGFGSVKDAREKALAGNRKAQGLIGQMFPGQATSKAITAMNAPKPVIVSKEEKARQKTMTDLDQAMTRALAKEKLLGDEYDLNEEKLKLYRDALDSLIESGIDPADERALKLAKSIKVLAEEQEKAKKSAQGMEDAYAAMLQARIFGNEEYQSGIRAGFAVAANPQAAFGKPVAAAAGASGAGRVRVDVRATVDKGLNLKNEVQAVTYDSIADVMSTGGKRR